MPGFFFAKPPLLSLKDRPTWLPPAWCRLLTLPSGEVAGWGKKGKSGCLTRFMPKKSSLIAPILALLCAGCSLFAPAEQPPTPAALAESRQDEPWILIDSRSDSLTLYQDGKALAVFENVAFGAAGVKEKRQMGDDVTPRGTYAVGWIRREGKFVHFIGLNYPSVVDAKRGLEDGIIDRQTFERIRVAHEHGEPPPQNTKLGGYIGIHGVGKGSLEIHRLANWTAGCIAVENHQIRRLARLIRVGTRVEIQ